MGSKDSYKYDLIKFGSCIDYVDSELDRDPNSTSATQAI